jgi:hypothetical protein
VQEKVKPVAFCVAIVIFYPNCLTYQEKALGVAALGLVERGENQ